MQTSPKAHQRQASVDCRHDARSVGIHHMAQGAWCAQFLLAKATSSALAISVISRWLLV